MKNPWLLQYNIVWFLTDGEQAHRSNMYNFLGSIIELCLYTLNNFAGEKTNYANKIWKFMKMMIYIALALNLSVRGKNLKVSWFI